MKCRYCASTDSKVIDSRPTEDGSAIRRRRECVNCGKRFTTYLLDTVLYHKKFDMSRNFSNFLLVNLTIAINNFSHSNHLILTSLL